MILLDTGVIIEVLDKKSDNGKALVTDPVTVRQQEHGECGSLFYDLPILNRLCQTPVQNRALSILSFLICATFHPSIFLSAANPDSELLL